MSRKRMLFLASLFGLALAVLAPLVPADVDEPIDGLTKHGSGIVRHPAPASYPKGELKALPAYRPESTEPFQIDLRDADLSKLDLTGRADDLLHADFDVKTRWPAKLPAPFDPARLIELGRNPGLGLRALHARGITGKGVGIAVIDMGLLTDHVEYASRLKLYEEIHSSDVTAQMHGTATASIAAGSTVGVAPGADLYYIATSFADFFVRRPENGRLARDFTWMAQAINRILDINRSLPEGRKIRVISISIGWGPEEKAYDLANQAVERAKKEGVFVISTSVQRTYGLNFHALGRDPLKDPDQASSFGESTWDKYYLDEHPNETAPIFVPMDSRATASPTGNTDYVFYRYGGWSWAVPYIAGLYALACQVKPEVTPEEFWRRASQTGDVVEVVVPPSVQGETEKLAAEQVDAAVARAKSMVTAERPLGKVLAEGYSHRTGEQRDTMTEAEFRAWAVPWTAQRMGHKPGPHQIGRIVNPTRLMESLRK